MTARLSVEELLGNLEQRAAHHREREAFHAQQEAHHREQRTGHAAELEKISQTLEAFRTAAAAAIDLGRPLPLESPPAPAIDASRLPSPGRLMVGRLITLAVESADLKEPFGPAAVAAETSRLFADRLEKPVGSRTASDALRRMLAQGEIQLVRKGTANREALYKRKPRRGGS
ncbi:MAG TPA: hypothetical protein VGX68_01000 [Thermoanaerobaculia bacterium]|jgi:hypothetical protein|nr:hypothetical protein [Thermoanaerobaculia bacterium]